MSHWEVICHLTSSSEILPWTCLLVPPGGCCCMALPLCAWLDLLVNFSDPGNGTSLGSLWQRGCPCPHGPKFSPSGGWCRQLMSWLAWLPIPTQRHYAPSLSPCARPCQPGLKPMHKWSQTNEVNRSLYRRCCQYGQPTQPHGSMPVGGWEATL